MADYLTTDTELTSIADAIRTKGGTSASLAYPAGFISAINAIKSGLEYEEGTYTATATKSSGYLEIRWANSHSKKPCFTLIADTTASASVANCLVFSIEFDAVMLLGDKYYSGTSQKAGKAITDTRNSSNNSTSTSTVESGTSPTVTSTSSYFRLSTNSQRQIISGRTYKWIAIWK